MRLFYCPECRREEINITNPPLNKITYRNIRDGYGRPITHYECECGNILAGSIDVSGFEKEAGLIDYFKMVIEGYNKGGCYYVNGLYEAIEASYNASKDNIKDNKIRVL